MRFEKRPKKASVNTRWDKHAKEQRERLIDNRLLQLRSRREDLAIEWDDDLPLISKLIEISVDELRKYRDDKIEKAKRG